MSQENQHLIDYLFYYLTDELYAQKDNGLISDEKFLSIFNYAKSLNAIDLQKFCKENYGIVAEYAENMFKHGEEVYHVRDPERFSEKELIQKVIVRGSTLLNGWAAYEIHWGEEGFSDYLHVNGIDLFRTLEEAEECKKQKILNALKELEDKIKRLNLVAERWRNYLKGEK